MEYIELHAHTAFSFKDGASQPDELVLAAANAGYSAFAITDHDNLAGIFEFVNAAKAVGVKPIIGAEVSVIGEAGIRSHVTLIVRTAEGYANLCRLITKAYAPRREGLFADKSTLVKGSAQRPEPQVTIKQLCEYARGLTLLTGCAAHGLLLPYLSNAQQEQARSLLTRLRNCFGAQNVYIELQLPQQRGDTQRVRALRDLAIQTQCPTVATGNVHAHNIQRGRLHEALVAIRKNTTLEGCEQERDGNLARVLRSPEEMARRFMDYPDAVQATQQIAESVEFRLEDGIGYRYPDLSDDSGQSADALLAELTRSELERRYAGRRTLLRARARLESELAVIARHGLAGFFLLHHDVLELAKEVAHQVRGADSSRRYNPPGRGRGSSVESMVCYLTGLSHIDPLEANLRMGRFLNEEMNSLPDIDLDFPRDIRHALLAQVVERYGADRCAMVAAHATYRTKGAIRDVGRVLALPQAELTRIAAQAGGWGAEGIASVLDQRHTGPRWEAFRMLTSEIRGIPRSIGQHSGGVIISTKPLNAIVPIQPAATAGRQIVQWDKDSCSDAGFLKIDVLGLGMLSAVDECVETISLSGVIDVDKSSVYAPKWVTPTGGVDLSRIPLDDRAVYADIELGDTVGTFQIESRAQIQSLKRVRPRTLDDLTVQVALIRPGPIIGQSVNPYVAVREKLRRDPHAEIPYDHPLLEPVLRDTYGAIVFQDQVIEVSMQLAGFSMGEADGLRRAMSRKRAAGSVEAWRPRFLQGAKQRGVSDDIANRVFDKVIGFCHYGFPRAHSVAFALLAYQSAWLRHHFPAHFHAALLNAQPMGFYPPDSLLRDAARNGVQALPVDINQSDALCTVVPQRFEESKGKMFARKRAGEQPHPAIRVGLGCIQRVRYKNALAIEHERERAGKYVSLEDLLRRAPVATHVVEQLIMAGACDSFGASRRELLWQLGLIKKEHNGTAALDLPTPEAPALKQLSIWDEVVLDFETQGLSVRGHPVELLRPLLGTRVVQVKQALRGDLSTRMSGGEGGSGGASGSGNERSEGRRGGEVIDVVGVVTARQRPPTAKGVVFLLLEDETGQLNVIVPAKLYQEQKVVIRSEAMLRIRGRIERHDRVVNFIAQEIHRLPSQLRERAAIKIRGKEWG